MRSRKVPSGMGLVMLAILPILALGCTRTAAGPAPGAAATTEEVLALMDKGEASVKTLEADIKIGSGATDEDAPAMTGHMALQYVMKDGKHTTLSNAKMGAFQDSLVSILVNDGEFVWQEVHWGESDVTVVKRKPDPEDAPMVGSQKLRDEYDLRLAGEE